MKKLICLLVFFHDATFLVNILVLIQTYFFMDEKWKNKILTRVLLLPCLEKKYGYQKCEYFAKLFEVQNIFLCIIFLSFFSV